MPDALTGDDFEQLYRDTAGELFGYLRRRGAEDPEDIVAEVYAIAWKRRTDLPRESLRRAWLFGAARRVLWDRNRSRARHHEVVAEVTRQRFLAPVPSTEPNESSATRIDSTDQLTDVVAGALAKLGPADQEILRLTEWECLTPGELGVALGIRQQTARVRLHRPRRRLAADPDLQALMARRQTTTRVD